MWDLVSIGSSPGLMCSSPHGVSSNDESSSGEERAYFSICTGLILAAGNPTASCPPASDGNGGCNPHCLATESDASGILTAFGHCQHTQCGLIEFKDDSDILAAERLKAQAKNCHQCMCKLSCNATGNDGGNLI